MVQIHILTKQHRTRTVRAQPPTAGRPPRPHQPGAQLLMRSTKLTLSRAQLMMVSGHRRSHSVRWHGARRRDSNPHNSVDEEGSTGCTTPGPDDDAPQINC